MKEKQFQMQKQSKIHMSEELRFEQGKNLDFYEKYLSYQKLLDFIDKSTEKEKSQMDLLVLRSRSKFSINRFNNSFNKHQADFFRLLIKDITILDKFIKQEVDELQVLVSKLIDKDTTRDVFQTTDYQNEIKQIKSRCLKLAYFTAHNYEAIMRILDRHDHQTKFYKCSIMFQSLTNQQFWVHTGVLGVTKKLNLLYIKCYKGTYAGSSSTQKQPFQNIYSQHEQFKQQKYQQLVKQQQPQQLEGDRYLKLNKTAENQYINQQQGQQQQQQQQKKDRYLQLKKDSETLQRNNQQSKQENILKHQYQEKENRLDNKTDQNQVYSDYESSFNQKKESKWQQQIQKKLEKMNQDSTSPEQSSQNVLPNKARAKQISINQLENSQLVNKLQQSSEQTNKQIPVQDTDIFFNQVLYKTPQLNFDLSSNELLSSNNLIASKDDQILKFWIKKQDVASVQLHMLDYMYNGVKEGQPNTWSQIQKFIYLDNQDCQAMRDMQNVMVQNKLVKICYFEHEDNLSISIEKTNFKIQKYEDKSIRIPKKQLYNFLLGIYQFETCIKEIGFIDESHKNEFATRFKNIQEQILQQNLDMGLGITTNCLVFQDYQQQSVQAKLTQQIFVHNYPCTVDDILNENPYSQNNDAQINYSYYKNAFLELSGPKSIDTIMNMVNQLQSHNLLGKPADKIDLPQHILIKHFKLYNSRAIDDVQPQLSSSTKYLPGIANSKRSGGLSKLETKSSKYKFMEKYTVFFKFIGFQDKENFLEARESLLSSSLEGDTSTMYSMELQQKKTWGSIFLHSLQTYLNLNLVDQPRGDTLTQAGASAQMIGGEKDIEPKLFLANERTFTSWVGIAVIQTGLVSMMLNLTSHSHRLQNNKELIILSLVIIFQSAVVNVQAWLVYVQRRTLIKSQGVINQCRREDKPQYKTMQPILLGVSMLVFLLVLIIISVYYLISDFGEMYQQLSKHTHKHHKGSHHF